MQSIGFVMTEASSYQAAGLQCLMEDVAVALAVDRRAMAPGHLPLTVDALCETYAGRVYKFAQLVSSDSTDLRSGEEKPNGRRKDRLTADK